MEWSSNGKYWQQCRPCFTLYLSMYSKLTLRLHLNYMTQHQDPPPSDTCLYPYPSVCGSTHAPFDWFNRYAYLKLGISVSFGEIMPTNNVTKFILANLANSRAITPKCFMGSGWLSKLAEIFCQQTFSQCLMIIQWKLFKLLSGQMLWTTPLPASCVPVIRPPFSNGRIFKKQKLNTCI